MTRRSPSLPTTLGVVFAAMLLGVYTVAGFAPERLRGEAEVWLEETIGSPVEFRELRLVVGFPMHLEVGELVALGGALRVERISLRFSALSLLRGQPRASRVVVDGAAIALPKTGPEGPSALSGLVERWALPEGAAAEGLLAGLENAARALLAGPGFADSIELRRGRVGYLHEQSGSQDRTLKLEGVTGRYQLSRLRGSTQLWLSAGLRIGDAPPSRFEVVGSRARDGSLRLSVVTSGLELRALSGLPGMPTEFSGLAGQLQGVVNYSSPSVAEASIALDLVLMDLALPAARSGRTLGADRLTLRGRIDVEAEVLRGGFVEVRGEKLDLRLSAAAPRPLNTDLPLDLSLRLVDLELPAVRDLLEAVPESLTDALPELLGGIEAGRVRVLEAQARDSLQHWAQLFAEGVWRAPGNLQISADVRGLSVVLPDARRLHGVAGYFAWDERGLAVRLERGLLEGAALPELDLEVNGLSHFFAGDAGSRRLRRGAVPIPGAELFWQLFGPAGETGASPRLVVELDFLHHPALLWPVENVEMLLETTPDASEVRLLAADWGGVPLRGRATLPHDGSSPIRLRVEAKAPRKRGDGVDTQPVEGTWARGRIDMGPIEGPDWQQRGARGEFEMHEGELRLQEVEIGLEPRGELLGNANIDLRSADELPCAVEFGASGGETESLLGLTGLDRRSASGTLDVSGSLQGKLTRELPLLAGLEGELVLQARDGEIDQSLPPLVALALASQTFDAFRSPDSLRFERWETTLRFREGWMSAEAFELDGPDLRLFAVGRIDLLREPHLVEGEVAVFLFRQLDRALGEIPILNWVLMGRNENLLAAFFELEGPWDEPEARALPLRTLSEGPAGDMILAIPGVMQRGLRALGTLLGGEPDPQAEPPASLPGAGES